jgi:hypothetical protein
MDDRGGCRHCGGVAYEVWGDIDGVMSRNRSIGERKGSLTWFVPRDPLRFALNARPSGS